MQPLNVFRHATRFGTSLVVFLALLLGGCGGGGGGSSSPNENPPPSGTLAGQIQKGPFSVGSQITVNELNSSLGPTGKVYSVLTSDDLGNFSVASKIGTNLVDVVGTGFYMDEVTGQLAPASILLQAIVDLSVNNHPTVNVLTALQAPRLKALIAQGSTYAVADTQSRNEVLTAFGIDPTKITALTNLYSMKINGSTDPDAVLLAISSILSQMASTAAITNNSSSSSELSSFVSSIANQLTSTGTLTNAAILAARKAAAMQLNLAAVRANIETYYATKGVTLVAPKFEEWVDKDGSGILPRRLVPATGLTFTDVAEVGSQQIVTSNQITVSGIGAGIIAPVAVDASTTIIKNGTAVVGRYTTAVDGDLIKLQVTSPGYSLFNTSTITVGTSTATWRVTTKALGGTISGLTVSTGLVLQLDGGNNITIPAGSNNFSFTTPVAIGASYNVSVLTQPATPLQVCKVTGGTGTVSATQANISLACSNQSAIVYGTGGQVVYLDAATGALSLPTSMPPASSSLSMSLDPTGKFAYLTSPVPNGTTSSLNSYTIDARGFLIATGIPIVNWSQSLSFDATGNYAIVQANAAMPNTSVTTYKIDPLTGALTSTVSTVAIASMGSSMIDPIHRFVYVYNPSTLLYASYKIDATTGALTSTGSLVLGTNIAFVPNGKFAYVQDAAQITPYSIDPATGALTATGTPVGFANSSIFFDPTSKFAYIATYTSGNTPPFSIASFSIDTTTGILTPTGTPIATSWGLLTFDPTGTYAYAMVPGGIASYSIHSTTGALTVIGATVTGQNITPDPSGKFAYVYTPSTLQAYTVSATGLTVAGASVPSGGNPIAFDPSGKYAIIQSSASLTSYSIDAITGALTVTGPGVSSNGSILKVIPVP